MCGNNFGGNSCIWIILVLIILFYGCGGVCGSICGGGCCENQNGCGGCC